jgi:hypothetical protein
MDDERRMRDLFQATSGCMSHMCPILDGHLARELDVVGWGNRVGGFPFGGRDSQPRWWVPLRVRGQSASLVEVRMGHVWRGKDF